MLELVVNRLNVKAAKGRTSPRVTCMHIVTQASSSGGH